MEEWFAARTSTGEQWSRWRLAELKGETTVSVVVPAQNEAPTVGAIIAALRRELVEEVPLVDELVVVDSESCDDTAVVAHRAGARVVRQEAVLSHLGNQPGKGEALWKSLLVTDGDIVVFIDADLREFDAQFAVGLLGPLLTDQGIAFVKGFYDRPLTDGERVLPAGGGRVTELVARPLLNLHWPSLAYFVQPLAGEYAVGGACWNNPVRLQLRRRDRHAHRRLRNGWARCDGPGRLGARQHRNSSDAALGRMAAQVYLALLSRLQRYGVARTMVPPSPLMRQFVRHGAVFVPDSATSALRSDRRWPSWRSTATA